MIDHERFRRLAAGGIDSPLAAQDARDLEAHLAACPTCRAEERAMRGDARQVAALLEPVGLAPRVRSSVVASARGRSVGMGRMLLVSAALLVVGVGGAALLSGGQPQPAPILSPGPSPTLGAVTQSTGPSPRPTPTPLVPAGPFRTFQTYPAGDQPRWVDAADLDGDRDIDLVVANNAGIQGVTVLLGDRTGEFRPTAAYEAQTTGHVLIADVDLDERPDIVAAEPAGNVLVWRGSGRGALASPVRYPMGVAGTANGNQIAIGRFDADEWPDLAVVSASQATLSILLGTGDGSFGAPVRIAVTGGPAYLQAADFDGDAKLDLAIGTSGSFQIALLWGDGSGGFSPPQAFSGPFAPSGLAAGDLDSDGDVDLLSSDSGPGTMSILANDPAGPFFSPQTIPVPHPTDDGPGAISVGDVDADGVVDFVVGYGVHDELAWYRGTGAGSFARPVLVPTGAGPTGVVLVDVDGDGDLDAITANANNGTVSVHLNH